MGVLSGIGGRVDAIDTIRNWKIGSEADLQAYFASNTKGLAGRLAGNKDWKGAYQAYGHTPVKLPGDAFTFTGSVDGAKGVTGSVRVESVEIVCDIAAGSIIEHTVNFGGNGALDRTDTSTVTDATVPDPPSSVGCKVQVGTMDASPVWSELDDVQRWTLNLGSDLKEYVSSSTGGGKRRIGGNIDASFAIPVLADDFQAAAKMPNENDIRGIRLYVDATTYWLIEWGIFGAQSDVVVDVETSELIGCTLNGALTLWAVIGSTPTEGQIVKPSTVIWQP